MDNSMVRWIHLTDLHFGKKDFKWLDANLQKKLISKVDNLGHIDFILVTGDMFNQGNYGDHSVRQYAIDFIKELSKLSDHVYILPGNHDYKRNGLRDNILTNWKNKTKGFEASDCATMLGTAFNEFQSLQEEINLSNVSIVTQSTSISISEKINLMLFNTAVFAGQSEVNEITNKRKYNDDGKLWICHDDFERLQKGIDDRLPRIAAGHHPIKMFDPETQNSMELFFKNNSVQHYFCGHYHKRFIFESDKLTQHCESGLFKDGYSTPGFTLFEMSKSINSVITSTVFYYDDSSWEIYQDSNAHTSIVENDETYNVTESNDQDLTSQITDICSHVDGLAENSDGAWCLPYNKGKFNIYLSKPSFSDRITPHLHNSIDEVTYVIKGACYACIGGEIKIVKEQEAILMPAVLLHAFIPKEYPCEYITMGVENGSYIYDNSMQADLEKLIGLDEKLTVEKNSLETIEGIVEYLKSSILEVRWKAIDILKKHIHDSYRSTKESIKSNIESQIQILVQRELEKEDDESKLIALSNAFEFNSEIASDQIKEIILKSDNCMILWNCTYYILKHDSLRIDYLKAFDSLYNEKGKKPYFNLLFLSLIDLIENKNETLINRFHCLFKDYGKDSIPYSDILIYFAVWYYSLCFQTTEYDFDSVFEGLSQIETIDAEQIARVFFDRKNEKDQYKVLHNIDNQDLLIKVIIALLKADKEEKDMIKEESKKAIKQLKSYLRIIVSEKCNLNCPYCHHEGRIDALIGGEIKRNDSFDLKKILEFAKKKKFEKIKISGGEPLLFPDLLEICTQFKNDFKDIGITTNGTLIEEYELGFKALAGSNFSVNVSLNSVNPERYRHITGQDTLSNVQRGIELLNDMDIKIKINTVITQYNLCEMTDIIEYAARQRIPIKLLDLFTVVPSEEFKRISIAEIKANLMKLYRIKEEDFILEKDYLCAEIMGTKVLIPQRIYSNECQYNCEKYPCAEGYFGIRIYEDYSCAKCFNGRVLGGGIKMLQENIKTIQKEFECTSLTY